MLRSFVSNQEELPQEYVVTGSSLPGRWSQTTQVQAFRNPLVFVTIDEYAKPCRTPEQLKSEQY